MASRRPPPNCRALDSLSRDMVVGLGREIPGPLPSLGGSVCFARRLPPSCRGVEHWPRETPVGSCLALPCPLPSLPRLPRPPHPPPRLARGCHADYRQLSCSWTPGPTTRWSASTEPYPARFRARSGLVSHILCWVPRGELLPSRPCHSSGQVSTRSRVFPPLGPAAGATSASPLPCPPSPPPPRRQVQLLRTMTRQSRASPSSEQQR